VHDEVEPLVNDNEGQVVVHVAGVDVGEAELGLEQSCGFQTI